MISYNPVGYRPVAPRGYQIAAPRPQQLGNLAAMNIWDWLMLGGGAVVGGAGINGLIGQFRKPGSPNAIAILIDIVLAGVGVTLFVQKVQKMMA